jgi:hypothetical protein
MGGHFNTETVGANAFLFLGLVDSFWHGFILSLMSGAYYTLKAIKKAGF